MISTEVSSLAAHNKGGNPQVRRKGILVPLFGLEESPMFHRALVLVRSFHAPLEGWRRVLDLVPAT
jgi:hypothetical protein